MEKILITGSSGFVGSHLVEEALKRGLEVYAGIRATSSKRYLLDDRIKFVEMDFSDQESLDRATTIQYDYIIHNAGITKAPNDETYLKINKGFTQNFAEAIITNQSSLKKFTFTSSIAAYGPADMVDDQMVSNRMVPRPVTGYGRSKLAAEQYLHSQAKLPWIIIRPTAVYGPRDVDFLTLYKSIQKGIAGQIGFKDQYASFIFVEELARVMMDVTLSDHVKTAYFASDGEKYHVQDLNKIVAESIAKKIIKIKIPLPLIKTIAGVNELYSKLSGKATILNFDKVNELKAANWFCDINNLKKDINYEPKIFLKEGIEKTTHWYKTQNLI